MLFFRLYASGISVSGLLYTVLTIYLVLMELNVGIRALSLKEVCKPNVECVNISQSTLFLWV